MSYRASAAHAAAHLLCRERATNHDDLQSVLVEVGMPELLNRLTSRRFPDSVPTCDDGLSAAFRRAMMDSVPTAFRQRSDSFTESIFGEDGAAAAYLVQQDAAAVSEDDVVSLHPQHALARDSTADMRRDVTCPCCLGGFLQPVKTPCGHAFCMECLKTWLENGAKRTCPVCRTPFGAWRPKPADVDPDLERATRAAFGDILVHRKAEDAAIAEAEKTARAMAALAERERIRELLAQMPSGSASDAFAIRIGHRPLMSTTWGRLQNCYVEPVNKKIPLHLLISEVRFIIFYSDHVRSYTTKGPKFENLRLLDLRRLGGDIACFKAHIIWKDGLGVDPLFVRIDNLRAESASEIRALQLSQFCPSREARNLFNQFRECLEASVAENTTRALAVGNSTSRLAAGNSPGGSASINASGRLAAGSTPRRPFGGNSIERPAAGISRLRR